jgi:hypothetical protein
MGIFMNEIITNKMLGIPAKTSLGPGHENWMGIGDALDKCQWFGRRSGFSNGAGAQT